MHNVPEPHIGIDERAFAAPAGHHHDAGPECFVDRRLRLDGPIAAAVQRIAGAVEAQRHVIVGDVQIERHHRRFDVDARSAPLPFEELIADGVFHSQRGVFGMGDRRIAHVGIDGQRVFGRHVPGPVVALDDVVEFVGRADLGIENRRQDPNGGA